MEDNIISINPNTLMIVDDVNSNNVSLKANKMFAITYRLIGKIFSNYLTLYHSSHLQTLEIDVS